MRIGLVFALLAGALAFLPTPAFAAEGRWYSLDPRAPSGSENHPRVWMQVVPAEARSGAYGFVAMRFHNPHATEKQIDVEIREGYGSDGHRVVGFVRVEAGGIQRYWLPLGTPGGWPRIRFSVRGAFATEENIHHSGTRGPVAVLGVFGAAGSPRQAPWERALELGKPTSWAIPAAKPVWVDAASLPSDHRMVSGFDLVALDLDPATLDGPKQQALLRYVAAGGHLSLTRRPVTLEGPLRGLDAQLVSGANDAVGEIGARRGRLGLGTWIVHAADRPDQDTELRVWIRDVVHQGTRLEPVPFAGGIPTAFRHPLAIPGLGDVPVQAFFLLLLLFAILVGPVSYVWLKRRRRLPWLVVTIPVAGFLAAALILLYGFLSEGFGIRGSIRSYTVLDQRTHQGATAAGRTLYAGLPPSAIQPGPGTLIAPPSGQRYRPSSSWNVDFDAGWRLDGSALPSRTPTVLTTVTVGAARERLQFRRRDDGSIEVLHGPDFVPVLAKDSILLRTFEGDWYVNGADASGTLRPLPPGEQHFEAPSVISRILSSTMHMPLGDLNPPMSPRMRLGWYEPVQFTNEGPLGLHAYFDRSEVSRMPPGSYLITVESLPSLDGLGLDVDYEARGHVVFGLLAAEDIVE